MAPSAGGLAHDYARTSLPVPVHRPGYDRVLITREDPQEVETGSKPEIARRPASPIHGSIAAWAWGISRAVDYLETDRDIDATRIAITGVSRLGKTVMWAGAADPRIAAVIASCSGDGGAALGRRNHGETMAHLAAPARSSRRGRCSCRRATPMLGPIRKASASPRSP